jgi:hypothetical protein
VRRRSRRVVRPSAERGPKAPLALPGGGPFFLSGFRRR